MALSGYRRLKKAYCNYYYGSGADLKRKEQMVGRRGLTQLEAHAKMATWIPATIQQTIAPTLGVTLAGVQLSRGAFFIGGCCEEVD